MTDNGMIANFMAGVALADCEQAERVNIPQAAIERGRSYVVDLLKKQGWSDGWLQIMLAGGHDGNEAVQAFAKAIADEQERCARVAEGLAEEMRNERDMFPSRTDLTAQLDKAREALRPFARILDVVGDDPNEPDDADAFSRLADHPLNLGHLRAARACLPATSGDVG